MMIARRALCSLASKQNPSLSSSVRFPALLSSTSPHNPSLSSFVRYLCTGKHIIDVHPRLINCGVWIVPENKAFVIERFKKYHKTLYPGLHFMIPLVDRIAYVHSLKKEALQVSNVSSVTATRLPITMNCVLYVKVFYSCFFIFECLNNFGHPVSFSFFIMFFYLFRRACRL